jgi:hypothetical protein
VGLGANLTLTILFVNFFYLSIEFENFSKSSGIVDSKNNPFLVIGCLKLNFEECKNGRFKSN